jgi:predicted phage tail protein
MTGQMWAVGMGIGMAVGGIIQMTTKMPAGVSAASQESADQRPSFLFSGPTNTSSQGLAVPRGYGRAIIGSIVISATLYAEELAL